MDTIKEYVEAQNQKDAISQLLRCLNISIDEDYQEEVTEAVLVKIKAMQEVSVLVKEVNKDVIKTTAETYGVTEDSVLDSFMYFSLLVENVILHMQLQNK